MKRLTLLIFSLLSSSLLALPYQGLQEIKDLDSWSQLPFRKLSQASYRTQSATITEELLNSLQDLRKRDSKLENLSPFFKDILRTARFHKRYRLTSKSEYRVYKEWIEGLFAFKQFVIENEKDLIIKKKLTLLSAALAEELLYLSHLKFPQKTTWKTQMEGLAQVQEYCRDHQGHSKQGELFDLPVCQGDILLTVGHSIISSFLARINHYPTGFSHSLTLYKNHKKQKNSLYAVESLIEDGVKLRPTHKRFSSNKMAKFFVFRPVSQTNRMAMITGTEHLVQELFQRTDDPINKTAIPYDHRIDSSEREKLYCSEVVQYAGELGKADPLPYPREYWSSVEGARKTLLIDFLGMKSKIFSTPGDIQFNPNYKLVQFFYDQENMNRYRISLAIVDSLIWLMENNQEKFQEIVAQISQIEALNETVQKEKLRPLLPANILNQLPQGAPLKSIIFFGILKSVVEPQVTKQLLDYEQSLWTLEGKVLGPLKLRDKALEISYQVIQTTLKKALSVTDD